VFCVQDLDNRWLVKVSSDRAAAHLVRAGIDLYNRHIFVRYYDDVLAEEYGEFQRYREYQQQLQLVKTRMMKVTSGSDEPDDPVAAFIGQHPSETP